MKSDFGIGLVTADSIGFFEDFLPAQTVKDVKKGESTVVIGLTTDEKACGVIAGYMEKKDSFLVEGFYVHPEVRRRGGGTLLLDTLIEQLNAVDRGIAVKLFFTEDSDETEALYDFLIARGETESSYNNSGKTIVEHRFVIVD